MSRMSRGCLRCRQRRVKCDEHRPACQRCVKRNEVCEGYRDEGSIIFRHETAKVIDHANSSRTSTVSTSSSLSQTSPRRSRSVERHPDHGRMPRTFADPSGLTPDEAAGIRMPKQLPWLKTIPTHIQSSIEDESVDQFMEKYVIYPCHESSTPGFLEHLPSMFKEVNVEGRVALRWAVRAAAYADLSKGQDDDQLAEKALHCYGLSLSALGESLKETGKVPDDYDLMTVVVLDIFETFHIQDPATKGMHAQGMAHILRLRGYDQIYNTRGWSLFRLAHHRIQKQQLAFNLRLAPLEESREWLHQLNSDLPFVHLEKDALQISETCERARKLQQSLDTGGSNVVNILEVVNELLALDREVVSWRQNPRWAYRTVNVSDLPPFDPSVDPLTSTIELHSDIWMAYEWNYHRTARMIAHEHLLKCIKAALTSPELDPSGTETLKAISQQSLATIHTLAEGILSTVPQSLGDVDHLGRLHDHQLGPPPCRGIGGYMLLWPIKVVGGRQVSISEEQKRCGQIAFDRIREYTGMKLHLGNKSKII
ncbi:hypothetical protein F5Y19DRAFT_52847 [Xylariaceae sp. FL1651]|nr:hypothetical protein F5Y19DRAFT_52847 [Xylariaceae sp. FL1651]